MRPRKYTTTAREDDTPRKQAKLAELLEMNAPLVSKTLNIMISMIYNHILSFENHSHSRKGGER
jgi:hypothetical protein